MCIVLNSEILQEDIFTPAVILAHYLKQINFDGAVYALGSTEFRKILKSYGFSVIEAVPNSVFFL